MSPGYGRSAPSSSASRSTVAPLRGDLFCELVHVRRGGSGRAHREHGQVGAGDRDRAVAEVRRRPPLGPQARRLAQLQRRLERHRHQVAAPERDQLLGAVEPLGGPLGRAEVVQHRLHGRRHALPIRLAPRDRAERLRHERERGELSGEGLGGRHGALLPGPEGERPVGRVGQRAVRVVRDGERAGAGAAVGVEDRGDLRRPAGLADPDGEPAGEARLDAVQRLKARRGQRDRPSGGGLQQVAAEDGRVIGRPARDDDDRVRRRAERRPRTGDERAHDVRLHAHVRLHQGPGRGHSRVCPRAIS